MTHIPITRPFFDEEDLRNLVKPLETGWVVQGPFVSEFERKFAEHTGCAHAVATTSCTTALHLTLVALGVGREDEVIVPAFTWVATANVVEYVGARPVFCDIDLATYNLDPNALDSVRTERTRAVIPVHLFGLSAPMDPILNFARKHNLAVIEDAACGFGALYRAHHVGALGEAGCFSFHPRKSITTGEGGMITTNDAGLAEVCRRLRDHGASKTDLARHLERGGSLLPEFDLLGFNYRMTDFQGALGVSQLAKGAQILAERRRLARRYDDFLSDHPTLRPPYVPKGCEHAYQSYVCRVDERVFDGDLERANRLRNRAMARLEEQGIATRQGTHAVPTLGYYRRKYGLAPSDFPRAFAADRLSMALPLYVGMTDREQNAVCDALDAALAQAMREVDMLPARP